MEPIYSSASFINIAERRKAILEIAKARAVYECCGPGTPVSRMALARLADVKADLVTGAPIRPFGAKGCSL